MTNDEPGVSRLSSAASMRVLAHPTRLRLLELLRERGPLTAAHLGEAVDEAPGTISYHLGRLATIDLIEPAPPQSSDQRERWWQAATALTSWEPSEHLDDPASLAASSALEKSIAQVYAARYAEYVDAMPAMPVEWVAAGTSGDRSLRLTLDELVELRAELDDLAQRWADRSRPDHAGDGEHEAVSVSLVYQAYRRP